MRKASLFIAAMALTTVAVLGGLVLAQDKEQGGRRLTTILTGAAEVPGPGDADGSGSVSIEHQIFGRADALQTATARSN